MSNLKLLIIALLGAVCLLTSCSPIHAHHQGRDIQEDGYGGSGGGHGGAGGEGGHGGFGGAGR